MLGESSPDTKSLLQIIVIERSRLSPTMRSYFTLCVGWTRNDISPAGTGTFSS